MGRRGALLLVVILGLVALPVYASGGGEGSLADSMANLVVQLALAYVAAWSLGTLMERFHQPAVLGELLAGVIIGPYLLGGIGLPGFPHGLFPEAANFPVSTELYGFASMAAIVLLFSVGLETDIDELRRYILAGSAVGIAGVAGSFVAGDLLVVAFGGVLLPGQTVGVMHPAALFMGVVCSATSVGISARILSETRKTQDPEGVTILSGAVIDDILGIILLAVVLGIAGSESVGIGSVAVIGAKAFLAWGVATGLGLLLAPFAERGLKKLRDYTSITHLTLAMALLLAGILEKSGLAMIIGAYIVGLSISKTDLNLRIQEQLRTIERFFVPLFFCIMGMLVDVSAFGDVKLLMIGLLIAAVSMLAKVLSCGVAVLPFGFNLLGAARVGMGMAPRGEVTLIVAGVGLSAGVLNTDIFNIAVILTIATALVAPPVLSRLMRPARSGLRRTPVTGHVRRELTFSLTDPDTLAYVVLRIERVFEEDGWVATRRDHPHREFHLRKAGSAITMIPREADLTFDCPEADAIFVETLYYEEMAELERMARKLQSLTNTSAIGKRIFTDRPLEQTTVHGKGVAAHLHADAIVPRLQATDKKGVLSELVDAMVQAGILAATERDAALEDILARESDMTTGMQDGIALPHARTDAVSSIRCTIGLAPDGIDFDSMDGQPATIFVLTLAPRSEHAAYLRLMSQVTSRLLDPELRQSLLACDDSQSIHRLFDTD